MERRTTCRHRRSFGLLAVAIDDIFRYAIITLEKGFWPRFINLNLVEGLFLLFQGKH